MTFYLPYNHLRKKISIGQWITWSLTQTNYSLVKYSLLLRLPFLYAGRGVWILSKPTYDDSDKKNETSVFHHKAKPEYVLPQNYIFLH